MCLYRTQTAGFTFHSSPCFLCCVKTAVFIVNFEKGYIYCVITLTALPLIGGRGGEGTDGALLYFLQNYRKCAWLEVSGKRIVQKCFTYCTPLSVSRVTAFSILVGTVPPIGDCLTEILKSQLKRNLAR